MVEEVGPETAKSDGGLSETERWALIKAAYQAPDETVDEIAARLNTSRAAIMRRAKREGWVRRRPSNNIDRPLIIVRLFRVLERQVIDLETEAVEMTQAERRSGEKEAALMGKLAANLEKLVALDLKLGAAEPKRRSTKEMQSIRQKLIERIEQLKRT
jgi:hypothetical protein